MTVSHLKTFSPALLLIDIQKGFEDVAYWGGQRNNVDAEKNAGRLLHAWRSASLPVFHVQHCSRNPRSPLRESHKGNAFQDVVKPQPGEPVIKKHVNSAFIGTDLQQQLDHLKISQLVVAGLTTDHCISTTVRMAGNLGYDTHLVSDATATFNKRAIDGTNYPAEIIHDTALASLREEFATIVTTQWLLEHFRSDARIQKSDLMVLPSA
jgi:nicotinamidase-related amidase